MIELILSLALSAADVDARREPMVIDAQIKSKTLDMADDFASCAGVWDFVSRFEEMGRRPASAKQAKETANGAMLAAAYLASMIHHVENPEVKKTYGEFMSKFEGRRDSSLTQMLAMAEREDVEGLKLRMDHCGNLLEVQEDLITEVRRSW